MYIVCENSNFTIADNKASAVARIETPGYIENGIERTLPPIEKLYTQASYADENNYVQIRVEKKNDTLFYIHRKWKNLSSSHRKIQTIFRVTTNFEVDKYLIPCVSFNGNEFGNGLEPKGLYREGKPWIFGYDHVSIPSCTLTENADYALALFASAEDENSLCSSCSISKDEQTGRFQQTIYHPVIEKPVAYVGRDIYGESQESFIELEPGACFECGMYLEVSKPRWNNFGISQTLDSALDIFGDNHEVMMPDSQKIWNSSMCFAKSLITDYKGKKGFIIGYLPDGKGGFQFRKDQCFELAWAGQNVLFCRMFIEDYIRYGHKESLDVALEILDTRIKYCTAENGLIASQLRHSDNLKENATDTCNMGYGAYEILLCYERLKEIGIEKKSYLDTAQGVCDFFCEHFSESYGFGKMWSMSGVCLNETGSAGAFLICPMVKLFEFTGEMKYLHMAEKALEFYVKRDLNNFCCKAGALDTNCVDKESCASFLIGAILLYQATKKDIYLEYGQKAAYYITSWMFHYQPKYGKETDIIKYNICIKGLTSVSVQHHHVDVYAALGVPYLRKLAEYTGDERWNIRADMIWRAVLQGIGDGNLKLHEVVRPVGSQNEAVFHCCFTFGEYQRGALNDWLVAWPCAFRLMILAEEKNENRKMKRLAGE